MDGLPIPVGGEDLLRRLARDVDVLKRHTHQDRYDGDEDPDYPYPTDVVPKAPDGLDCYSQGQLSTADYIMSWVAPTENVDNSEITDLLDYEFWWQYDGDVGWTPLFTTDTTVVLRSLTPGSDINWQVRTRDRAFQTSDWATATCTGLVLPRG